MPNLAFATEILGGLAAALTTLCWLPQALKILRERQTEGISLTANVVFASGIALWLTYGLLLGSWPLIGANAVTLALVLVIITLKLRYG